jgi:hypothetical protein
VLAKFNLTSVALFLLATTLANLQSHTGLSPADALRKVEELVAAQVEVFAEEFDAVPEPEPTASAPASGRLH